MKTSTAYKLERMRFELSKGWKPQVSIRGLERCGLFTVRAMRNLQHSLELELDRNGGLLIIDPDDILAAHVRSQTLRSDPI